MQGLGAKARTADADHQNILVLTQTRSHFLNLRKLRRHFARQIERGIRSVETGRAPRVHALPCLIDLCGLCRQFGAAYAFAADALHVEVGRVDDKLLGLRIAVRIWLVG